MYLSIYLLTIWNMRMGYGALHMGEPRQTYNRGGTGAGGQSQSNLGRFRRYSCPVGEALLFSLFVVTAQAIYVSLIDMCASVETRDFWAFFERLSAVFNCISFLIFFFIFRDVDTELVTELIVTGHVKIKVLVYTSPGIKYKCFFPFGGIFIYLYVVLLQYLHKLEACLLKKSLIFGSFLSRANNDPPGTKTRLYFVERSGPDQGSDRIKQKQSFGVVPKPKWGGDWKVCIGGSDPLSQSIRRGRMSRLESLGVRDSRVRSGISFALPAKKTLFMFWLEISF